MTSEVAEPKLPAVSVVLERLSEETEMVFLGSPRCLELLAEDVLLAIACSAAYFFDMLRLLPLLVALCYCIWFES